MIELLKPEVQKFIQDHLNDDIHELSLKFQQVDDIPIRDIVEQIRSRQKSEKKLPNWFRTEGIIYPPALSIEQCSSETTAHYKSTLFEGLKAVDLTGGTGVDTQYLSRKFEEIDFIEQEKSLVDYARYNFDILGINNCVFYHNTAEEFLAQNEMTYDLIYIDPSRRSEQGKVFQLKDSSPNVVELEVLLVKSGKNVLIKTSPFLDIHKAEMDLKYLRNVLAVGVKNEVKEVLYHLSKVTKEDRVQYKAVNILKDEIEEFTFTRESEEVARSTYSIPNIGDYLYEPNSSVLKLGAFKLIGNVWRLDKLSRNSHLYCSPDLVKGFQGRIFEIKDVFQSVSEVKKGFASRYLNIISRNFTLNPKELKTAIGSIDGGEEYLIATRAEKGQKLLFHCQRIK